MPNVRLITPEILPSVPLLVPVVILFALPLAVTGAFVALAVIGHATNIVTGLAVSLQDAVLPVTVITAGKGIIYSVGDG
jgi:hypothetical protein